MNSLPICTISDLDEAVPYRFELEGSPVVVVRLGDRVHAIGDTCSHADISLSDGEVDTDECALECPAHGSLFSLETGEALCLPAVRSVPVYPLRVDGSQVVVDL